jgi:hypothetical protein
MTTGDFQKVIVGMFNLMGGMKLKIESMQP